MLRISNITVLFSVALFSSTTTLASPSGDISPADVITNALPAICAANFAADPNTALSTTCQTFLGLAGGPGGGNAGNAGSAGISTGVLNSTIYSDRHKKAIRKRKEELQAASGDILSGERLGFFASGKMTETERENTTLETGYESDTHGFTVGMDYFFSDQLVAGIAVDYADTDLDYSGNAGNSDYESVSVITYGSFNANNGFSLDGYLGWTGIEYDIQRNMRLASIIAGAPILNVAAKADTEANKVLVGINIAHNLNFNAIEFTPSLKLDYSGTFLDGYTESDSNGLALKYDNQDVQSFKSNLGFDSSYAISMPWGVILPQIHAGYVHEFLDHRRTIHASFVQDITNTDLQFKTDKPDRDYFVFGGGISTVLAHSVQLFVDYERTEGHRYLNSYTVSGGLRVGF